MIAWCLYTRANAMGRPLRVALFFVPRVASTRIDAASYFRGGDVVAKQMSDFEKGVLPGQIPRLNQFFKYRIQNYLRFLGLGSKS